MASLLLLAYLNHLNINNRLLEPIRQTMPNSPNPKTLPLTTNNLQLDNNLKPPHTNPQIPQSPSHPLLKPIEPQHNLLKAHNTPRQYIKIA